MGAKQSALKKEIAALHQEARKRSAKHQEELAAAAKEKRLLQVKIDELQASVTTAQEEVVKMKSEAREREERMKALKWELVRQIKMSGSPTSSPRASLSPSSSARISLNWKLNDDVTLRHSVVSPTKKPSIGDTVERCIEKSPTQAVEAPKKEPNTGDAADSRSDTSSAPSTGRSLLLAPRRSLINKPEGAAASLVSPNQAADAKETSQTSEMASKPFDSTSESKPSKVGPQKEDDRSPRESKNESSSDDLPPKPTTSKDAAETKERSPRPSSARAAESKGSDCDGSPETNDVLHFSQDDSSNDSS